MLSRREGDSDLFRAEGDGRRHCVSAWPRFWPLRRNVVDGKRVFARGARHREQGFVHIGWHEYGGPGEQ